MAECQLDKVQQEDQQAEESSANSLKDADPKSKDELFKELSRMNGIINKMDKIKIIDKLNLVNLSTEGTSEVLKKRLKNYYRKKKLSRTTLCTTSKLYPYYVVIDFEATCQEINGVDFLHEIIEFPAVLVDAEKEEIIDEFQSYCKPTLDPILSSFCVELTGITQEQVNNAEPFPVVLKNFELWLSKHKLGTSKHYAFVTDGPWDMGRFLFGQCNISGISYPSYAKKWINLRKSFSNFYKSKRYTLNMMLSHLGMRFEGRPHCGLDDARNIAFVLLRMICDGAAVQLNERITWSRLDKSVSHVLPLQPSERPLTMKQVRKERMKKRDENVALTDSDVDSDLV